MVSGPVQLLKLFLIKWYKLIRVHFCLLSDKFLKNEWGNRVRYSEESWVMCLEMKVCQKKSEGLFCNNLGSCKSGRRPCDLWPPKQIGIIVECKLTLTLALLGPGCFVFSSVFELSRVSAVVCVGSSHGALPPLTQPDLITLLSSTSV